MAKINLSQFVQFVQERPLLVRPSARLTRRARTTRFGLEQRLATLPGLVAVLGELGRGIKTTTNTPHPAPAFAQNP
jgi:hypothetical protein